MVPFASATSEDLCMTHVDFLASLGSMAQDERLANGLSSGVDAMNAGANKVVDTMQSIRGENLLLKRLRIATSPDDFNTDFVMEYKNGLIVLAAPGIALAVLAFLAVPFVCCCHKCCCKAKKAKGEYTFTSKIVPAVVYVVLSLICVGLAFAGVAAIGQMTNGLTGSICELETMLMDLDEFFTNATDPLFELANATTVYGNEIIDVFLGLTDVAGGMDDLVEALGNMSTYVGTISIPDLPARRMLTSNADMIADLQTQINDAATAINDTANAILDPLFATKNLVETNVVAIQSELVSAANSAKETVASLKADMGYASMEQFINDAKSLGSTYMETSAPVSYGFFSFVFIGCFAGIFALVTFFTPCKFDDKLARVFLLLSWNLTFILVIVFFLLSGIFLPISASLSDVCVVVAELPKNFSQNLGPLFPDLRGGQVSSSPMEGIDPFEIIQGCFANPAPGIFDTLNLKEKFNMDSIFDEFDANQDKLDAGLDLSSITNFTSAIRAMNYASFDFDPSDTDAILSALNARTTPNVYGRAECTPTPSCDAACLTVTTCASVADNPNAESNDSSGFASTREAVIAFCDAEKTIDSTLAMLESHADTIDLVGSVLGDTIDNFVLDLKSIKGFVELIMAPIDLLLSVSCGFVGVVYFGMHDALCTNTVSPLMVLSIYMFFIALLGIPLIVLAINMNTRLFGAGAKSGAKVWTDKA